MLIVTAYFYQHAPEVNPLCFGYPTIESVPKTGTNSDWKRFYTKEKVEDYGYTRIIEVQVPIQIKQEIIGFPMSIVVFRRKWLFKLSRLGLQSPHIYWT